MGGCYYYSVFDDVKKTKTKNLGFFDMSKSITRDNPNYGESLFYPGAKMLASQPLMRNKYEIDAYSYNLAEYDEYQKQVMSLSNKFRNDQTLTNKTGDLANQMNETSEDVDKSTYSMSSSSSSSTSTLNTISIKNQSLDGLNDQLMQKRLNNLEADKSFDSLSEISDIRKPRNSNEDDYYTADESEHDKESIKRSRDSMLGSSARSVNHHDRRSLGKIAGTPSLSFFLLTKEFGWVYVVRNVLQ